MKIETMLDGTASRQRMNGAALYPDHPGDKLHLQTRDHCRQIGRVLIPNGRGEAAEGRIRIALPGLVDQMLLSLDQSC